MLPDHFPGRKAWSAKVDRAGGVVLNPLAEIGIRVLMFIGVRRRQFMVDILCDSKRSDREQKKDEPDGQSASQPSISSI
jgi:hypothetical protein